MPRTYKPTPKKIYTDVAVENALLEHQQVGTSIRALAEKHKIPNSTLQRRLKDGPAKKVGCKTVFTLDQVFVIFNTSDFFSLHIKVIIAIKIKHAAP